MSGKHREHPHWSLGGDLTWLKFSCHLLYKHVHFLMYIWHYVASYSHCVSLQGISASLSVLATHHCAPITATAVTITTELTIARVRLDTLALAVSWWTGVFTSLV